MPHYQGGGDMIKVVTFEKTTYADIPYKFEAGTPNIAGGIGLGAALDYTTKIGIANIAAYEHKLVEYGTREALRNPGLAPDRHRERTKPACSPSHQYRRFIRTISAPSSTRQGIAVRTGHHCAQPVMDFFNVPATTRASLAFYNTFGEIDALVRRHP